MRSRIRVFWAAVLMAAALVGAGPTFLAGAEDAQAKQGGLWPAGEVGRWTGYVKEGGSQRVREVQRRLRDLGLRPGPVDGLFGPRTEAATKRLQRREGLKADGIVGRRTLSRLRAAAARRRPVSRQERSSSERPAPRVERDRPTFRYPVPPPAPPMVVSEPSSGSDAGVLRWVAALLVAAALLAGAALLGPPSGRRRRGRDAGPDDHAPGSGGAAPPTPSPEARQPQAPTSAERRDGRFVRHERVAGAILPAGGATTSTLPATRPPAAAADLWTPSVSPAPAPDVTRLPDAPHPAPLPNRLPHTVALRLVVAVALATIAGWLFFFQGLLWESGRQPEGTLETVVSWGSITWVLPLFPALFGIAGFLLYRRPAATPMGPLQAMPTLVAFRIVSRGDNADAVRATVANLRTEMARAPLFPYRIEVVTDLPIELPRGGDLRHIVVPPEYRTPHRSLYKARALQYALERSSLPDGAWILHLDEESHITSRLVAGIRDAVSEEERSGQHRIGQGAILYHRNLRRHPVMTLADMIRTGDDFGRFYCQQRLGVSLFGLHGSFILVRNSVERAVGFDFGRDGSITEDAFWALVQMQRGYRTRWVDGYMVEQSPQSVADFVKQRRRWFIGLIKVVRHAPVALRFRLGLLCSVVVWSMAWLGILYSYVNLVAGFEASAPIQIIGNVAFATFIATYVLGLKLNLDELPPVGALRAVALYVAQVVLIPVFALLEAAGVLYALVKPDAGFHVIRKEQS